MTDSNDKPNLIFYEVLTGTLDTGQQIMVQVFRRPDGKITLSQVAFRSDKWQSWGVPVRLQHISTTPSASGEQ